MTKKIALNPDLGNQSDFLMGNYDINFLPFAI